jgi:hypothetical protein
MNTTSIGFTSVRCDLVHSSAVSVGDRGGLVTGSGRPAEDDAREVVARLQAIRRDAYTTVRSEEI